MKIDRHNYEEYFILYMDNELSAEERMLVESFVQANPDLKEEFELLQQFKLTPDESIVFHGKEELMKSEKASFINLSNYTECLLLYTDNEVTASEKSIIDKFAAAYPDVKKELEVLQLTKLQPEPEIVFANKEILYRHEKERRVVSLRWVRYAVAAVLLLGVAVSTIVMMNNKNVSDRGLAAGGEKSNSNIQKISINPSVTTKENTASTPIPTETTDQVKDNNIAQTSTSTKKNQETIIPVVTRKSNENDIVIPAKAIDNNTALANNKTNNLPVNRFDPGAPKVKNIPDPMNTDPVLAKTDIPKNIINNPAVTNTNSQPSTNKAAADNTNSDAIFASDNGAKKSKLRGFFRKATRIFEKATNIDPTDNGDKVLIGAVAVSLK